MRRLPALLAAVATLSLAVAPVAANAAPACANVADQSAFEVLALRQMMTLLATKCGRDVDYNNNFVKRFQPALQRNYRDVLTYFRRVYGGAGQGRMDTFTTELVNVMSQQANTQGAEFCPRAAQIISEMNALKSMDELPAYAGVKDLAPAGVSMCPTTVASRRGPPRKR